MARPGWCHHQRWRLWHLRHYHDTVSRDQIDKQATMVQLLLFVYQNVCGASIRHVEVPVEGMHSGAAMLPCHDVPYDICDHDPSQRMHVL